MFADGIRGIELEPGKLPRASALLDTTGVLAPDAEAGPNVDDSEGSNVPERVLMPDCDSSAAALSLAVVFPSYSPVLRALRRLLLQPPRARQPQSCHRRQEVHMR